MHDFWQRCQKSVLFRRLAGGAFWSLIAALGTNFGNLLTGIILAHILGKYTYGQYGMLRTTLNMFILFSSFSLGATATKYVAEYRDKDKKKTGRVIGLSLGCILILAIVTFFLCYHCANILSVKTFKSTEMSPYLRIGAWLIPFAALNSVLIGVLSGLESFKQIAKINIYSSIFFIILSINGAKYFGLKGSIIALSIYLCSISFLSFIILQKELIKHMIVICFRDCIKEIPVLWSFSLPSTIGGLLSLPVLWFGVTMLIRSPSGFAGMAGYDIINQWRIAALFIPNIVGRIVLPILSNLCNKNQNGDYWKVIKFNSFTIIVTTMIIAFVLSITAPYVLQLYGNDFLIYTFPFVILMVGAVFNSINVLINQIMLSKGFAWWSFCMTLMWAVIYVCIVYYLVTFKEKGVLGLSLSFTISYAIYTLVEILFLFAVFKRKNI